MRRTLPEIEEETLTLNWLSRHPHLTHEYSQVKVLALLERSFGWLNGRGMSPSEVIREELMAALQKEHIRYCRVCGCTEDYACPGGCSWSQGRTFICSKCA